MGTAQLNCSVCGRFIGNDGDPDIAFDYSTGMHEIGYPTCPKHLPHWKKPEPVEAQE